MKVVGTLKKHESQKNDTRYTSDYNEVMEKYLFQKMENLVLNPRIMIVFCMPYLILFNSSVSCCSYPINQTFH